MSFSPIPLPSFVDVPAGAGLPNILGSTVGNGIAAAASSALGGIEQNWIVNSVNKHWGLFDKNGKRFATSSRTLAIDYSETYSIPSAPLTDGSFSSYNKVKDPYVSRVALVCDGTESGSDSAITSLKALVGVGPASGEMVRKSFMSALSIALASTDLYTIVTPEASYYNANLIGVHWRRDARQGVSMLVVELTFKEIRNNATLSYSSTRTPAGSLTAPNGNVQTQPLPAAAQSAVTSLQQKSG